MQIKRFEAKDMTTALRLVKNELGPDAVILSARSLKKENRILGLVKSAGVEVTAAVDGYHLPSALNPTMAVGAMNSYRRTETISSPQKRNFRSSVGSRIKTLYDPRRLRHPAGKTRFEGDEWFAELFQHLLSQEIKRDTANDLIDALSARYSAGERFDTTDQIISGITEIVEQRRIGVQTPPRKKSGCRVEAVVGPTGVGKTTTVAKLAARHAIECNQDVALISLDADRVGGTADLKVYAGAIGVPFKAASTPVAFKTAVDGFRTVDLVLVDTSGFNPKKQGQIDDLKACLGAIGAVEIHLALSAAAKEIDMRNTLRCLNNRNVHKLIFTKLDESFTYGNLINVLLEHPLPLSYATSGRSVPHAIETGSIAKIVGRLMGSFKHQSGSLKPEMPVEAPAKAAARSDGSLFVANKNSDVFHRYDCKWTRKIKSTNMITFSSAQAARLENFMPCQDCLPARSSPVQTGLPTRDNVRISNYS